LLPQLPKALARRAEIAKQYEVGIDNPSLSLLGPEQQSTWHIYPVFAGDSSGRDSFRDHLQASGIQTAVHYPILASAQLALDRPQDAQKFPVADRISQCEASLPLHPYLTDDDVQRVISTVNSWRADQ
jgi:dTDP-3-amino-3,4,6-trideoxy-alpha-D-glucose transaminase